MANIRGVVNEVKFKQTTYGPMYDIVVDGTSYGAGKYAPKAKAGDVVEFEAQQKGRYNNVAPGTLRVVGTGGPQPAPAPASRSGSVGGYQNKDKNQEIISKQAARNSAIAFMNLAQAAGALPLGAASAKVGDKFDALSAMCDEITEKFFNYSQGIEDKVDRAEPGDDVAPPTDEPW